MKKIALLAPVAAAFLMFFASCEKNDPDSIYDSASSSSVEDIEYALKSTTYSPDELMAFTSSLTFSSFTHSASGSSNTAISESRSRFMDSEGNPIVLNVMFTDFVANPDELSRFHAIGSSSYTEVDEELNLATQEMTNITGHGAATIASYPVSGLTASSSLTDVVNYYPYDVDLTYLNLAGNTSGWIYDNDSKDVVKIYLLVDNRFGLVIETDGSSDEEALESASINLMEQLEAWMADQQYEG